MKKTKKRFGRRKKTDQIIRIEELEEVMSRYGKDVDPEDIVSMYIPHRRRRRIGAALLQLDKLHLLLMDLMLLVAILFITAFMQEKMGNFTINLNRLELYRKGISISDTGDFEKATARLTASTVQDATNISIEDLPDNIDAEEEITMVRITWLTHIMCVMQVRKTWDIRQGLHWIPVPKALKRQSGWRFGVTENG